jgi:hypothetical protein
MVTLNSRADLLKGRSLRQANTPLPGVASAGRCPPSPACAGVIRVQQSATWRSSCLPQTPTLQEVQPSVSSGWCDEVREFWGFGRPTKNGRCRPRINGGWGVAHFEAAAGTLLRGGVALPVGDRNKQNIRIKLANRGLKSIIFVVLTLSLFRVGWAVQEPDVTLEFIQTSHPSSFPTLIRVSVTNVSYTPFNLVDRMKSSQLVIDGKPAWRKDLPFAGPAGLSAMGHWDACVSVGDYTDSISPGWHHMIFKMGEAQSKEVEIQWSKSLNWRQGNLKTRTKEIENMGEAIKKGMPRSCVEEWLTVKDGGEEDSTQVRYYLDPFFKVLVPYAQQGGEGLDEEFVAGPAKVYKENRIRD